jgi:parallel beta-helix repeat protein
MTTCVSVADGWSGIEQALAAAQPGSVITLEPGRYTGERTLAVPSGVTVSGTGSTLVFLGDGPVIQARGVDHITLDGLTLDASGASIAARRTPDAAPYAATEAKQRVDWGLIWLCDVADSSVVNSTIKGCGGTVHGILATGSRNIAFFQLQISATGTAIALVSSQNCAVADNRCHDNARSGIGLSSSDSTGITGNECWGNHYHGIILQRDPEIPNAPAANAPLTDNRCHDNDLEGIILFSSDSTGITGNECWGNRHGIVLVRDPKSPDAPANAPLTDNRCHDNAQSGIVLVSSDSTGITGNECWGNHYHGIMLTRDPKSPDAPANAPLADNRCHGNIQAGIILFSSDSTGIAGNECWGNRHGIILQRDPEIPDAPANAPLADNRCHGNTQAGIALISSDSTGITGNECWGNHDGIVLTRDPKSPDAPANAPLADNRCHDNTRSGIILFSSDSTGITGNECWGNHDGIVLQRDPKSPDAPANAPLADNRCHDNREHGFVIDAAASGVIEPNNVVFRNRANPGSVRVDPAGRVIADITAALHLSEESPHETRHHNRSKAASGALATQLEDVIAPDDHNAPDPDALARFLYGHGSLHDLARSLGFEPAPHHDDAPPLLEQKGAVYALRQPDKGAADDQKYRFDRKGTGLDKLIWDRVAQHVISNQPAVTLIGAFGATDADIKRIVDDAAHANNFDVDTVSPSAIVPTGRRDLLRALQVGSVRVVQPLVVDYAGRANLAQIGAQAESPFLEPEVPVTGWRAWMSRIGFVVTARAYWRDLLPALLGVIFVGFVLAVFMGAVKRDPGDRIANPIHLAWEAVEKNIENLQLHDVAGGIIAIIGGTFFIGLVGFLNKHLPWHLQIRPKRAATKTDTTADLRKHPWKRWIMRRLLPRQSVSLVILRNVLEWQKDDRDALIDPTFPK